MKIYLKKHLKSLLPADHEAEEYLQKVKPGVVISCDLKRPRNYENHKRFFALMQIVVENQERFKSVEELKEAIKLELGYVDILQDVHGNVIKKPKSINFASMGEESFQVFFSKAIDVIIKYVIPGIDREDLLNEVIAFG